MGPTPATRADVPAGATAAAFHIGRVLLASLYISGGLNKIAAPEPTIASMEAIGMPIAHLLIYGVIVVELGLGLVVAVGGLLKDGHLVPWAAVLLIAHTVVINVLIHNFWAFDGLDARIQLSLFFKNLAVMGGLAVIGALYAAKRADR